MAPKPYPWPLAEMIDWYENDELTIQEISDRLSSEDWQAYWIEHLGRNYRPGQKIVNKVLKRSKCNMRPTGAPGERNYFWNGGRVIDTDGYVCVYRPDHPHCDGRQRVREHRLVAEKALGRYLKPDEVVHHIDGNKENNAPGNLIVFGSNSDHISLTMTGKVPPERIAPAQAMRWKDHVYIDNRYNRARNRVGKTAVGYGDQQSLETSSRSRE